MTILTLYGLLQKMVLHTLNLNGWNQLLNIFMIGPFEGKLKNKLKHLWKAQFQIDSSDFLIQMWAFSSNMLMTQQNILQMTIKNPLYKGLIYSVELTLMLGQKTVRNLSESLHFLVLFIFVFLPIF